MPNTRPPVSARRKAPKAAECWAIAVSSDWFEGTRFAHDGTAVKLFMNEGLAKDTAFKHMVDRKHAHGQDVFAEPIRVRIVPVARKRRK